MRRILKFAHTMGAIGLLGSMASLLVISVASPPPTALVAYAATRSAMANVATWLFLPSLFVVLAAGLAALAATRAFHDAGWAWIKLASGLALFEGGLQTLQGPMREEADRAAAAAVAARMNPAGVALSPGTEHATLIVLLVVATANVGLAIWRPRLLRLPD